MTDYRHELCRPSCYFDARCEAGRCDLAGTHATVEPAEVERSLDAYQTADRRALWVLAITGWVAFLLGWCYELGR